MDQTHVLCIGGGFLTTGSPGKSLTSPSLPPGVQIQSVPPYSPGQVYSEDFRISPLFPISGIGKHFLLTDQIVNVSGFASHTFQSLLQLLNPDLIGGKVTTDYIQMNEHGVFQ